jgi:predicted transcriptional regulator YheO
MDYRESFISQVNAADKKNITVQLAKQCIKHRIPVSVIAEKLKVSRPTVYAWFIGKSTPIKSLEGKVASLLKALVETP